MSIPNGKLVGLSLSYCVRDIATGVMDEARVTKIVSNTRIRSEEEMRQAFNRYDNVVWKGLPHAREIAARLIREGRVEQPRVGNPTHGHGSLQHWITEEEWAARSEAHVPGPGPHFPDIRAVDEWALYLIGGAWKKYGEVRYVKELRRKGNTAIVLWARSATETARRQCYLQTFKQWMHGAVRMTGAY